jgi:hypothetical protein
MFDWNLVYPFLPAVVVAIVFAIVGILYRPQSESPADGRAGLAIIAFGVVLAAMLAAVAALVVQPIVRKGKPTPAAGTDPTAGAVAWVQYGQSVSDGAFYAPAGLIARVLLGSGAAACPAVALDGKPPEAMAKRDDPRAATFGTMCDYRLQGKPKQIVIAYPGQKPLLDQAISDAPSRIAALGDTGCRITSYTDQGCGSASTWPFGSIAESAATAGPKLVIHLGDYFYRETPCAGKATPAKCSTGPYGDREATWRSDFFEPAKPLLKQAPWIFLRGNHEDCARGGYGWFYYFGDGNEACEQYHRPAYIPLTGLTLLHFDSAHADDKYARQVLNDGWEELKNRIAAMPAAKAKDEPVIILTHKPVFALCEADAAAPTVSGCDSKDVANVGGARAIVAAVRATGRRTIALGGDIHIFQAFDIGTDSSARSPVSQIILGNGGAVLEDEKNFAKVGPFDELKVPFVDDRLFRDTADKNKWKYPVPAATTAIDGFVQVWREFGFGTLDVPSEPAGKLFLTVRGVDGARVAGCDLTKEGVGIKRCQR